jgi:hypothetical protein
MFVVCIGIRINIFCFGSLGCDTFYSLHWWKREKSNYRCNHRNLTLSILDCTVNEFTVYHLRFIYPLYRLIYIIYFSWICCFSFVMARFRLLLYEDMWITMLFPWNFKRICSVQSFNGIELNWIELEICFYVCFNVMMLYSVHRNFSIHYFHWSAH